MWDVLVMVILKEIKESFDRKMKQHCMMHWIQSRVPKKFQTAIFHFKGKILPNLPQQVTQEMQCSNSFEF